MDCIAKALRLPKVGDECSHRWTELTSQHLHLSMVQVLMTSTVIKLNLKKKSKLKCLWWTWEESDALQDTEILGDSGSSMPHSFMSLETTGIHHILKINVFHLLLVMKYVRNCSASHSDKCSNVYTHEFQKHNPIFHILLSYISYTFILIIFTFPLVS